MQVLRDLLVLWGQTVSRVDGRLHEIDGMFFFTVELFS